MDKLNLRILSLLACSFLLPACDGEDAAPEIDEELDGVLETETELQGFASTQEQQVPTASPPISDCNAGRVIGILHNAEASCSLRGAVPPNWVWRAMFSQGSPGVDALTIPVPVELRRYCAFDYINGEPKGEDLAVLHSAIEASGVMSLDSVASDCRGEFPQAGLDDIQLAADLHAAFRANIDWLHPADLGTTQQKREKVDVTVVDTVAQEAINQGLDPVSEHGLYMAELIGDIACPDGDHDCLEQLRYTLAMPRIDWDHAPDWVKGGGHGTQGDVALAIYEAVGSWHERRIANPTKSAPRLVLNLSIGWNLLTQDTDSVDRGPAKSIISALQYASCQGALVFVAAGNNPDEGCPANHIEPLAPAAFEEFRAPTEAECNAMGFGSPWAGNYPVHGSQSGYEPLVHAVGGVDEYDRPIINARIGGTPRMVALGSNGVVVDNGAAFAPLTGTSVSAAVASGIASLVWSYRPELRPHEIAEIMYEAGWKLGTDAEFGTNGVLWPQQRLSVCAALDSACEGQDPDACPKLECEAEAPALDGNLLDFFKLTETIVSDPATQVDTLMTNQSAGAPVCETFDYTNLADPQPPKPVCSRCSMSIAAGSNFGDDSIKMQTEAMYDGMVTAAWVTVYDAVGSPAQISFDNAVITSLNSPTSDVTIALVHSPTTVAATLNFVLSNGTKQSNSIPVSLP
jgi:hypothetical protein